MRVEQPVGERGSLKWLQLAVNQRPAVLQCGQIGKIEWLSPLAADNFAEYRDAAFLDRLGLSRLARDLKAFWPARGPQWDALGRAGDCVVLVEAKAHLDEFFSPPTRASGSSREKIRAAFDLVGEALGATGGADWTDRFYQYANRLAHLYFLRGGGVDASLLFVDFVNDEDMRGPKDPAEWLAAFRAADDALGLPKRHPLRDFVFHVFPDVRRLKHLRP